MVLGFEIFDLIVVIVISLAICITVCTLAMEAAVLFVPAFLFLFPFLFAASFPKVSPNEAIGLAITIEFFGYTSSVIGYWFRKQVHFGLAFKVLAYTVPLAVVGRIAAYFVSGSVLMVVFAVVLLVLAFIIFRAYQGEVRHTCLLCGDSLVAMRYHAEHDNPGSAKADKSSALAKVKALVFDWTDRAIVAVAGVFAGLVGVAIGEISNTFLTVRKQVPIKVATGTSALILHITILSALVTNLIVLWGDFEIFNAEDIEIPWNVVAIIAPTVIIGGQIGAYLNSRLADRTLIRAMIMAYTVIGVFVLARV